MQSTRANASNFYPAGIFENSPAFQRREGVEKRKVPSGTAESGFSQSSLRDLTGCKPIPGVETPGYFPMLLPEQNNNFPASNVKNIWLYPKIRCVCPV